MTDPLWWRYYKKQYPRNLQLRCVDSNDALHKDLGIGNQSNRLQEWDLPALFHQMNWDKVLGL